MGHLPATGSMRCPHAWPLRLLDFFQLSNPLRFASAVVSCLLSSTRPPTYYNAAGEAMAHHVLSKRDDRAARSNLQTSHAYHMPTSRTRGTDEGHLRSLKHPRQELSWCVFRASIHRLSRADRTYVVCERIHPHTAAHAVHQQTLASA